MLAPSLVEHHLAQRLDKAQKQLKLELLSVKLQKPVISFLPWAVLQQVSSSKAAVNGRWSIIMLFSFFPLSELERPSQKRHQKSFKKR